MREFLILIFSVVACIALGEVLRRYFLKSAGIVVLALSALGGVGAAVFVANDSRSPDMPLLAPFMGAIVASGLYPIFAIAFLVVWHLFVRPTRGVLSMASEHVKHRTAIQEQRKQVAEESRREQEQIEEQRKLRESRDVMALAASTAARRRRDALARCEMQYSIYEPELQSRFPRSAFERYVGQFMRDLDPPDEVEARGEQLLEIIEKHRSAAGSRGPRFQNVKELSKWFIAEKEKIAALPVDEAIREEHVALLEAAYSDLSHEVMERQYR